MHKLHNIMILHLKPTSDELENLEVMTKHNLEKIYDYKYNLQDSLSYQLPLSQEDLTNDLYIALQIKDVLAQGGRVILLTPDSAEPQELTLKQEA